VIEVAGGTINVGPGGHVILKHGAAPNTWALTHASGEVEFCLSKLVLKPATTRTVTYSVPQHHLGKPINPNDVALMANLAIDYFDSLLAHAEAEFCR
jgi:hypothetical protein